MTRFHSAFAAIGLLAVAAPAFADVIVKDGSMRGVPYREVRYGDLNLDTQAGIDTLNSRLQVAVRAVCGPLGTNQLERLAEVHNCRDASLDRAYAARDDMLATRIAARENPGLLAAATPSLAVVARHGR